MKEEWFDGLMDGGGGERREAKERKKEIRRMDGIINEKGKLNNNTHSAQNVILREIS